MTHRWISTDSGIHCFRCGLLVDYLALDDEGEMVADEETERAAHELVGWCDIAADPESRAHHYVLIGTHDQYGYALDCAYGDARITYTSVQIAHHGCIGA